MELFKAHILYRVRPNLKVLLEAFQFSCRKTSGEPNSTNIDPHVRQLTKFYSTLQVTISATVGMDSGWKRVSSSLESTWHLGLSVGWKSIVELCEPVEYSILI